MFGAVSVLHQGVSSLKIEKKVLTQGGHDDYKVNFIIFLRGGAALANHKSALKRARQSEVRKMRNKARKTRVKNVVKQVLAAVSENSAEKATQKLSEAVSLLQKTAAKKTIHKKTAARKVSRLYKHVNRLSAS
jgi:small subunit ribosomal protein S20